MNRLHFPHISRLFSANDSFPLSVILVWSVLTACIIMNILSFASYSPIVEKIGDFMGKKHDFTTNTAVSDWFENSDIPEVARELRYFQNSQKNAITEGYEKQPVLGSQTRTLKYWETIIKERPDYRDAYIAAAKYALQENNSDEAIEFLNRALILDPNNQTTRRLMSLLEKYARK